MTAAATFSLVRGSQPLLVSLPHAGRAIPPQIAARLVPRALAVEDTDWHLERLYDFVPQLGASLLVPHCSRYVIDLNRPPGDTPMYAGANNTGLVPLTSFSGEPLYRDGKAPGNDETRARVAAYWQPYHDALAAELARLHRRHGFALLWDGHSIRSELPWLFAGRLPDLNLGTAAGSSCAAALRNRLIAQIEAQVRFGHVADGRFTGGYITRHYGRPGQDIHAVQMEMTWSCYLDEADPAAWNEARAADAKLLLRTLLGVLLVWRPNGS
ncbi:MAG: N-formylglutamate deformylase [Gammaproteobacteria bacterium]|nr:MAG: N-formylglutamate deformylase [Gammaproteobacteria bacterium]